MKINLNDILINHMKIERFYVVSKKLTIIKVVGVINE